ncbi:hypothetical protein D9756_008311 [Leucocoprinus leucothites]|uniref:DUF6535 domain-containing protein n=1 Tax=Leucocoprinus leucothites TaxID=201217 RepID=A0A8H5D185_9AGAR|nr:hypothetical protein D9756_008311 [Leucoagaricus leucothites]
MNPTRSQSLGSDFSPEDIEPSWISGGRFRYPVVPNSNPWEGCFKPVHRHDKEMCGRWRDEVDKLLVFAGLFSAAVTAFTVEAFKMLQADPTAALIAVLESRNQTTAGVQLPGFSPSAMAVRINIFWFLSLVLSLSTVVIGVLSMQWLREYQRDDNTTTAEDALGLRQMRYQGLLAWRVPEIISALPVLLQTAVLLFFCGMLDLLWSLHRLVAIVVTVPVALLAVFLVATTVLPALQYTFARKINLRIPQCSYKSPQSWMFHRFFAFLTVFVYRISEFLNIESLFRYEIRERHSLIRKLFAASDWRAYDKRWRQQRDLQLNRTQHGGFVGQAIVREDIAHALAWVIKSFSRDLNLIKDLYRCFQSMGDDEKEAMLLKCERITPLAVDFRDKLGGEGGPAISDYLCLRGLDHLLSAVGYGSDGTRDLLQHRVELYIRLVKASIHLPRRPMLYCPFKYYSRFSDEVQIQLLDIATTFLSRSDRESDFATAIIIFTQTALHPAIRVPLQVHGLLNANVHDGDVMDSWEGLRKSYSSALKNATSCILGRREIIAYQSVRVHIYRWFLRVILSTSSTKAVLELTLPTFKSIAPVVQSSIPPSSSADAEYPTNPIFQVAWRQLLEGKYAELAQIAIQNSPAPLSPPLPPSLHRG